MKSPLIAVVTLSLAMIALALPAQARDARYARQNAAANLPEGKVKPGSWEFTAQLERAAAALPLAGVPTAGGQQAPATSGVAPTYRMCVEPERPVPSELGPNCKLERVTRNDPQIDWSMACTTADGTVHSNGAAQYHGLTMAATLVNHVPAGDGKVTDITQRITGRYLGPCTQAAMPAAPVAPAVPVAPAAPNVGTTIEPPPAAPNPPARTAAPAGRETVQRETVERAAPPPAHYRRYAMPRRHYYRRHYGYARAYGPPNILALPFMALHGIFGR